MKWATALTTVPARRHTLLPATLASLAAAGWQVGRLFVDGDADPAGWRTQFNLPTTCRDPAVRTFGAWWLALLETYLRDPSADLYGMFQDDFLAVKNARQYVERTWKLHPRAYFNLFTFPSNQSACPRDSAGRDTVGWFPGRDMAGNTPYDSPHGPIVPQTGRGAVALVLPREAVQILLSARHMALKPTDAHRGHKSVDGAVVTAMNQAGWREMVHSPSLTQHVGDESVAGNMPHPRSLSFPGEDFDALDLLVNGRTVQCG